jgi:hypothetical protein
MGYFVPEEMKQLSRDAMLLGRKYNISPMFLTQSAADFAPA